MYLRALMTTVAAASLLVASSAVGADNETHISQSASGANAGGTNSALVLQSGGTDNQAGSDTRNLTQIVDSNQTNDDGSFKNVLTITQGGDGNEVGLGVVANRHGGPASANGIYQINTYGTLWGRSTNSLEITQSSYDNSVGAAFQSLGSRVGHNSTTISQGGSGGHIVESLTQRQGQSTITPTVNSIAITQTGTNNRIARVEQYSGGKTGTNTIVSDISGNNNGHTALTGFAAASGATTSSLLQGQYVFSVGHFVANNSSIELTITGSNNAFGVSQFGYNATGGSNTVGQLTVSGDYNQLGTYQSGDGNTIELAALAGDYNNIGIRQLGDDNEGEVDVDGDGNQLELLQNGISNKAEISITGDYNGAPNTFTGQALSVATLSRPSGLVEQLGNDNLADLTIGGNSNAFTVKQGNNANELLATVSGNNNQMAVVQTGGDYAFASQNGLNNNLGISQ